MVGWHHRLNGHEFEQAQRDGNGQGSWACGSPWGSDMTERLNNKGNRAVIGLKSDNFILNKENGFSCVVFYSKSLMISIYCNSKRFLDFNMNMLQTVCQNGI